jgi:hypothetical protein
MFVDPAVEKKKQQEKEAQLKKKEMPKLKLAGNITVQATGPLQSKNPTDLSINNRKAFLQDLRIKHIQKKSQNLTLDHVKQTFQSTELTTEKVEKKNKRQDLMNKGKTE